MAFGPPWNNQDAGRRVPDSDELLARVRAAAEKVVDELRHAEVLTGNWANEELTDALVDAALSRCLKQLGSTGCWGEANRLPSSELWRIAGPTLEVGWLQNHARLKPHGYAGDHEMLARICRQTCCEHPLGRLFDRYFLRQAAPQAVRSRTQQTAAALVARCLERDGSACHVVSVGAGPAIDIQAALTLLPADRRRELRVTLLDLDPEPLDVAARQLQPLLPTGSLACVRANLFRLAQGNDSDTPIGTPDFLICSGLFDYLDDGPALATLALFWRRLAEKGRLLVGNFAPHNPTRAYMEWIGNWYLTYRTAAQMEQLARRAGIPQEQFLITSERLGVDLFLDGQKR